MFKEYFIILLLSHILGDYYFQTDKMAKKKEKSFKWLIVHCIVYWLSFILISIPVFSFEMFLIDTIMAVLHFIIDSVKYYFVDSVCSKEKNTLIRKRNIYFIDQGIHLLYLAVVSYILTISNFTVEVNYIINDFFSVLELSKMKIISWITVLLILHKPANISIASLLAVYKPLSTEDGASSSHIHNPGEFIGTLERIIILIFISITQYSAIGLVLTAKSIARYDRISKEKDFAEYYLLGTLLSTVLSIVVSFLLK